MMRAMRSVSRERRRAVRPWALVSVSLAVLGGGCSADVARFDFPGFAASDKNASGSIPRPSASLRSGGSGLIGANSKAVQAGGDSGSTYVPAPPISDSGVKLAALPEPVAPASRAPGYTEPKKIQPSAKSPDLATSAAVAGGQTIEVQAGDTLFGLSKKHRVSVAELMSVNSLANANLKPGQKLLLPAASGPFKPGVKSQPAEVATATGAAVAAARTATVPAKAANWDGSYTVKQGDSIYAIARQYRIAKDELQQANGISDPLKVRPGTVLRVPAAAGSPSVASVTPATVTPDSRNARDVPSAQPEAGAVAPRVIQSTTQPTIINGERKVAARTDTANDAGSDAPGVPAAISEPGKTEPSKGEQTAAAAASVASNGKLRWPVKGKVLTSFGPRSDGTHNDGVNLSVPLGTEVHAAESGVVAYAGSELKGYGNLILVRHDNGWVTAYAHNDELIVKRGDRVKRGQVLAKAGKSGQVDQPQVHFELRQGSKPVDPTPFMEKM